jgi:hypothetical protein
MKQLGKTGLFVALVSAATLNAENAATLYRHLVGVSVITANDPYLKSGWYKLSGNGTGDKVKLNDANFVGSYYFGQIGDTWRPFVTGGFGFSKITQDHVDLGTGDLGDVKLDSTYLKAGGGINYNPTDTLSLTLGGTGLWMKSDGNYNGIDPSVQNYFNKDSDTSLYDLYGSAIYHLEINGYKPYAKVSLRHLSINYDFDLSSTRGWETDLSVGTYTPTLSTWMELPVRGHFYVAANFLDHDLSGVTGFNHAYHAGMSLLWKIGPMIHLFDDAFKETELAFNLQGTTGDNDLLSGWKTSVSFNIAKF